MPSELYDSVPVPITIYIAPPELELYQAGSDKMDNIFNHAQTANCLLSTAVSVSRDIINRYKSLQSSVEGICGAVATTSPALAANYGSLSWARPARRPVQKEKQHSAQDSAGQSQQLSFVAAQDCWNLLKEVAPGGRSCRVRDKCTLPDRIPFLKKPLTNNNSSRRNIIRLFLEQSLCNDDSDESQKLNVYKQARAERIESSESFPKLSIDSNDNKPPTISTYTSVPVIIEEYFNDFSTDSRRLKL
ncbi:hypothetical protein EAG_06007 [Camponotus floridanus]|uniref:Uncharacterized protein n=1 Tax=Camponotus floridanus TaxID=104421 RepID=E2AKT9_CAMFO|nr:hypothetical protein EAG_06007 [Camponotus floridanus]